MADAIDEALAIALLNPVATAGEVRLSLAVSGYAILSTETTADIVGGLLHIIAVAMPPELRAQDPLRIFVERVEFLGGDLGFGPDPTQEKRPRSFRAAPA